MRHAGFQENAKPAGDELQVIARERRHAGGRYVESDDRHMRGRRPRPRRARLAVRRIDGEHVVERHHAVGQVVAEGADMADGKQLDRGQHRPCAQAPRRT